MKKIQAVLAAVAILAAGAGVFANARATFAIKYFRAPDAQFNTPGALCGIEVDKPCNDVSGPQCTAVYNTIVNGVSANRTYFISKTLVDNGPCEIALRN